MPELSRSRLQELIGKGAVMLDGDHGQESAAIKDPNRRVKPGEAYTVVIPATVSAQPRGEDIPLSVVYEDKDLIVIEKPAGLVVHPAAGTPATS